MPATATSGSNGALPTDVVHQNYAAGKKTYILSLTFPSLDAALPHLKRMSYGTDVWELRADLLSLTTPEFVSQQIALLKRYSNLPVLFTLRTRSQGGQFPDDKGSETLELLLTAVKTGCEYISIELDSSAEIVDKLKEKKGGAVLVASWQDWSGSIRWRDPVLKERCLQAENIGDIILLGILATDEYDSHELALFVREHRNNHSKPLITVGMGAHGQLSRAVAPISFVTHDLVPFSAAPGQLTLSQIHQTMHLIGQIPKRNFFIFGNNIAHSLSPMLHNTAFKELGLPHHYSIYETIEVDANVRDIMAQPDFGGASVTFPHKLQIGKFLHSESTVAKLIGAVNTVLVHYSKDGSKQLVGDNTDWLGIKSCIEVNWNGPVVDTQSAVVIGAGGASRAACYALQQLGVKKLYLINRTRRKAEELEKDFPALQFVHYASYSGVPQKFDSVPRAIVACVPADDFVEEDIPAALFNGAEHGVLVEMAYRPLVTALMKVGRRFRGWKVTRGVDVLKEQAYHQFSMWTGRRAPASVMAAAVDARC